MDFLHDISSFLENHISQIPRFVLSLFLLLTFIMLFYFFRFAYSKHKTRVENDNGLLFLALLFLFYGLLGLSSLIFSFKPPLLIFSVAINICLIGIVGFFSKGVSLADKIAAYPSWKLALLILPLLYLVIFLSCSINVLLIADLIVSIICFIYFGFFLINKFFREKQYFISLVLSISVGIIVLLQFFYPVNLAEGKFENLNVTTLYPGLYLSIIAIALTFNWISELRFQRVAKLFSNESHDVRLQSFLDGKFSKAELSQYWNALIAEDNLEKVIEEILYIKEKQKKDLEYILIIASRNSRNNTDRLKQMIADKDYNINRNQITAALIEGIVDV